MGNRAIAMRGWIVTYSSMIHIIWAITLPFFPEVMEVAPVSLVADWLDQNNYLTSIIFFLAGALAWVGSCRYKYTMVGLWMGIPQLFLLFMGAEACLEIIFEGVHPDGTTGRELFFLAQLSGSILLAPIYMLAVYAPYWKAIWNIFRS